MLYPFGGSAGHADSAPKLESRNSAEGSVKKPGEGQDQRRLQQGRQKQREDRRAAENGEAEELAQRRHEADGEGEKEKREKAAVLSAVIATKGKPNTVI